MHAKIEDLRGMANAYINEKILDDEQLMVKKHIAVCDDCYGKFCLEYLMQRELIKAALIPPNVLNESVEGIFEKVILKISKVRNQRKLVLNLEERFRNDARWGFVEMPYFASTRDGEEETVYQSKGSSESRIYFREGKVLIHLDEEQYQGDNLRVLLVDESHSDEVELQYDEDIGMYIWEIDLEQYSHALEIVIVSKE